MNDGVDVAFFAKLEVSMAFTFFGICAQVCFLGGGGKDVVLILNTTFVPQGDEDLLFTSG